MPSNPDPSGFRPVTNVYHWPVSASRRFDELGILFPELLLEAIGVGLGHMLQVTDNEPAGSRGSTAWFKVTGALRDRYMPLDWTVGRPQNLEVTVHPTGLLQIAVCSGTSATGDPDRTPQTKTERGPATQDVVDSNQSVMFSLYDRPSDDIPTYILLHYYDETTDTYRGELSLPAEMKDGFVKAWYERIMLPVGIFGHDLSRIRPSTDDDDDTGDLDVPVRRVG